MYLDMNTLNCPQVNFVRGPSLSSTTALGKRLDFTQKVAN